MSIAPADPNVPRADNVVTLGAHNPPPSGHIGNLLRSLRDNTVQAADKLVAGLLDNVDDTLFDLAEKAESNAAQTGYFNGMREVRKQRPRIERLFREQVARGFDEFAAGRTTPARAIRRPGTGSGELSLVDDRELEETLAVSAMVAKAEGRLSQSLQPLNQRLAVICGGRDTDNASNPMGPWQLTEAFRTALRELGDVDIRVRLIVLKMFERYVLSALEPLYHDINTHLVRAGVLPNVALPATVHRDNDDGTPAAPEGAAAAAAVGPLLPEDASNALHTQLMATLAGLLAARRNSVDAGRPRSAVSLTPTELLSALTLLQGESRAQVSHLDLPTGRAASIEMVQHIKNDLLARIERLSGPAHADMSGADEDTIDLVSMLFEYILQDATIPAPMQVLLARLQIPYLKVAILDRRMFAHASHPARQLLDQLAETAKGWSEESDRDHRLHDKIKGIADTLLADFDDDTDVFERLLQDFQRFVERGSRQAELAAQRAAEAVRGRERLQEARRRAAHELMPRIDGHSLPQMLHGLLTRPWANYIVLILLRQGDESPEFRSALHAIDDLVATATTPRDDAARQHYREGLPSLEKHLREGLATVAFQEPDIDKLLGELQRYWHMQLGDHATDDAMPGAAAAPAETLLPPVAAAQVPIDEAVADAADDINIDDCAVDVDATSLDAVRQLKVGSWVEFTDDDGNHERAKLSWISPISGKYLFVNRRGLKVADRTAVQLAAELADHRAMILEEVPLFDRALDAIVDSLRKAQAEAPQAQA